MNVQEPLLKTMSDVDKIDLDRLGKDEGIANVWETTALLDRAIGARLTGSLPYPWAPPISA